MDSFPSNIHVDNIKNFSSIQYDIAINSFRKEVYETIIKRKDESDYIDLDIFERRFCKNNSICLKKIVKQICSELEELGWKTKLSYGDTGLFIYSTENPPHNCW